MRSNKKSSAPVEVRAGQMTTIISEGCVIDGPLSAPGSVRTDGTINGNVKVHGSIIIGANARINGNVTADNVFLAGEIKGNVDARDGRVEISDTGRLHGDIMAHSLVIDEDAVFQGKCTMTSHDSNEQPADENGNTANDTPHGSADEARARLMGL